VFDGKEELFKKTMKIGIALSFLAIFALPKRNK